MTEETKAAASEASAQVRRPEAEPKPFRTHPSLPPSILAAQAAASARRASEPEGATRVRPQQFGGVRMKLEVFGRIPGYHLYWANNQNGEIESLIEEGFTLVTSDEVSQAERIVQDADIGNCISKYVGTDAAGEPMRAFLMKLPEDMWQEREAMRYAQADTWDSDIKSGAIQGIDRRYTPLGHETKLVTR